MADYVREPAIRLFAQEFRDSHATIEGEGERDPSYVVTPTGAKVNRVHVVGVCTDVEPVGETGDVFRARISDPTGVFTVYAGQYQPEAQQFLSELSDLPAFLAVTGKARTYEPEPGSVFVSIRPESVTAVDDATRDQWVLDAARRTTERLEALKGEGPGAELTRTHYGDADVTRYKDTARSALEALVGGEVPVHRIESAEDGGFTGQGGDDAPTWTPPPKQEDEADPEQDALDDAIFAIVNRLQGDDGSKWDDIVQEASGEGATGEQVEESLNRLMDKGLVYEPTLGVLKTT